MHNIEYLPIDIFNPVQLALCPWLRKEAALFLLDHLSGARSIKDIKMIFTSLLVHRVCI